MSSSVPFSQYDFPEWNESTSQNQEESRRGISQPDKHSSRSIDRPLPASSSLLGLNRRNQSRIRFRDDRFDDVQITRAIGNSTHAGGDASPKYSRTTTTTTTFSARSAAERATVAVPVSGIPVDKDYHEGMTSLSRAAPLAGRAPAAIGTRAAFTL